MLSERSCKIAIVDDHRLFAHTLKVYLETNPNKEVIGTYTNGKEIVDALPRIDPDIVLMDIEMPVMNGFEATKEVLSKKSDVKIVAMTMFHDGESVKRMLDLGAIGYLTKDITMNQFIEGLTTILDGDVYVVANAAQSFAKYSVQATPEKSRNMFTERELEVMQYIVKGLTNKEIGSKLNKSHRTIEAHKRSIMSKIGVSTSVGIAVYAQKNDIV